MLYICTKFHKIILGSIKVIQRTRFSLVNDSINSVGGVTVVYICTKFHENIFDGI